MIELPIAGTGERYQVNPTKIIALGLNYRDHIAESVSMKVRGVAPEIPEEPVLFPKTPNVLIGNGEAIVIPAFLDRYRFELPRVDHEAELALIVKDRCRNVPETEWKEHVLGFTCMNDVSQRNLQTGDKAGWFRGKSLDTFGPIGPVLVTPDEIGDPQNLEISCRLNGKTVQKANTGMMIFSVPAILAFVSMNFTLMPGDIIMTGTPSGVGPLADGDVVEVEIERIGVLRNRVVSERR